MQTLYQEQKALHNMPLSCHAPLVSHNSSHILFSIILAFLHFYKYAKLLIISGPHMAYYFFIIRAILTLCKLYFLPHIILPSPCFIFLVVFVIWNHLIYFPFIFCVFFLNISFLRIRIFFLSLSMSLASKTAPDIC